MWSITPVCYLVEMNASDFPDYFDNLELWQSCPPTQQQQQQQQQQQHLGGGIGLVTYDFSQWVREKSGIDLDSGRNKSLTKKRLIFLLQKLRKQKVLPGSAPRSEPEPGSGAGNQVYPDLERDRRLGTALLLLLNNILDT